ncbi:uncharacterized protein LOC135955625 [Calliphora vicina]|uniref:uncharacterized protein LOC135955625 n=1 Tax=Calliphora vicina TaxID=7373 RepID=UPI00325BC4FD
MSLKKFVNCTNDLDDFEKIQAEARAEELESIWQQVKRALVHEFENSRDDCAEVPKWQEFDKFLTHKFKTLESVSNIKSAKDKSITPKSEVAKNTQNKRNATVTQPTSLPQNNADEQPTTSAAARAQNIQSTTRSGIPNLTSLTLRKNSQSSTNRTEQETLLFTAIVEIETRGQRYQARAIIDPGSQSTFVSDKLKNRLKLPTKRNVVHVTGLSQTVSETSTKACLLNLCSRVDTSFKLEVWAPVLKTLPSNLPPQTLDMKNFSETAKLQLADPHFNQSRPIDLLIGLDLGPSIYCMDTPMRSMESLLAQKTVFGWIVGGPTPKTTQARTTISLLNTSSLDQILTRFWEVEETPKQILRSDEDTIVEHNFKQTTRRNETGRYIVTLPFKKTEEIGSSRNIAMAQYLRMERMLSQKPEIKQLYDKVILEYLELGHMRKIESSDIDKAPNYYLPHHAIIKPERLTTKLRVVFNASSPTSNKNSLNDILYPGPILQQDLVLLIAKWRFFRFVFNADITKMYRQILIDPTQTKFQRILFRKSTSDPIEDYELLTVTFGVNCAPFLAIRTLLQLAEEVQMTHPLASNILKQNMYVDDILAGGHTIEEAIKTRKELASVLKSAGFDLMKWNSNEPKVIQDLPSETLLPLDWLNLSENDGPKTLGIKWNISSDSFTFIAPNVELKETYTKREVLSTIAKFFDPCGWIAPVIVAAKLIMQQIWLDKTDWDDNLKPLTCHRWQRFVKNCTAINTLKIPRWIRYSPKHNVEIHGFSDASEKAYSATLYVRIQSGNSVFTFLLASKTRVAPIKQISLPRLELCGSVLLANLASGILPNLQVTKIDTYFWTDSTIVLAWLRKPPCSWNTFVGNRVSEIVDKIGNRQWQHVESKENTADIASRGCTPKELETHNLWWSAPSLPKDKWPKSRSPDDTHLEARTIKTLTTTTQEDPLNRFSNLPRAYRVIAYDLRFWKNTGVSRIHLRITSTDVTSEEIIDVKTRLIILTQKQHFPDEYKQLKLKQRISSTSSILTLNPFMDQLGVIRANGRLVQSPALTYNERHPILLPYNSTFSRLLTEFTHKITIHGGNQLMLRVLRTEFWIFRLKPLIKTVINNCKPCVLYKKHTQSQIMASLPPERTTISRPFTVTGVDYAGPFDIRNFTGRACLITKGYVCLFICFATKAVHLEAVSDLTTQAFLAAFARFIGRRGCPAVIYSDNGKNFVGAAELLKKDRLEFQKTLQNQLIQQYSHQNIKWKFIPPGAPHMGGLWEAGVKSFKTHLKKLLPNIKVTFEELSTILARIESCLNSRPLSPASDDPNDLTPLTPGHFLIGTPLLTPAELDVSSESLTLVNRWKRLKIIYHPFCQRWKTEYLGELHRRYKWKFPQENVKVNDLVVLKDNNLPPNEWKLVMSSIRDPEWKWSCGLCKEDHALRTCKRFLKARADERYDVVMFQRYCLNCLARSHDLKNCPNEYGCRVCTKRHNTLLHDAPQLRKSYDLKQPQPTPIYKKSEIKRVTSTTTKSQMTQTTSIDPVTWPNVFLPTATVRIAPKEKSDNWSSVRALLTQSLSISRIAVSTVKRLNLSSIDKNGTRFAQFHMKARNNRSKFCKRLLALITEDLPRRPYSAPIKDNPYEEFTEDTLADMDPQANSQIELELVCDVFPFIRRDGAIELEMGNVVATKTALGYTFAGPTDVLY